MTADTPSTNSFDPTLGLRPFGGASRPRPETPRPEGVEVRQLPPKRLRDLPEWEVTDGRGAAGWLVEKHLGTKSKNVFYHATALHPETGERVDIESSTDFNEMLQAIAAFRADPESSVHWRSRKW